MKAILLIALLVISATGYSAAPADDADDRQQAEMYRQDKDSLTKRHQREQKALRERHQAEQERLNKRQLKEQKRFQDRHEEQ